MNTKTNAALDGSAQTNGKKSGSEVKENCFVIMPIGDLEGYEAGHFRRVYEDLFIPACERAGYQAVRADEVRQTNLIHLDVLQKIIDSPMALCDLSSRNPNVLFELGLRQAFDRPVVLVQEIGTAPIFDINPMRYTDYHKEMLYRQVIDDQDKISTAICATKADIGNKKSINSIVKLLALAQPAVLSPISDADKDSAMFQVLMSEIGNLKSEIRAAQRSRKYNPLLSLPVTKQESASDDLSTESAEEYIDQYGLIKYLCDGYDLTPSIIRTALQQSSNSLEFVNSLMSLRNDEGTYGLGYIPFYRLEPAVEKARKKLRAPAAKHR